MLRSDQIFLRERRMGNKNILIVDDDPSIRKVLRFALEKADFVVTEASDGNKALETAKNFEFSLVVLDVMMPGLDGTEVCRELRKTSNVPVLFLSSRDEEIDKILGLELGGDDYLTKPFSPRELVARIRAILRRSQNDVQLENKLSRGRLTIDLDGFTVTWDGAAVGVTKSEFDILERLVRSPTKVFERSELMGDAIVSDRTIDSHIGHLRKKFEALGAEPITTVHGVGYKLGDCE